jgi:hypothetical protein
MCSVGALAQVGKHALSRAQSQPSLSAGSASAFLFIPQEKIRGVDGLFPRARAIN